MEEVRELEGVGLALRLKDAVTSQADAQLVGQNVDLVAADHHRVLELVIEVEDVETGAVCLGGDNLSVALRVPVNPGVGLRTNVVPI